MGACTQVSEVKTQLIGSAPKSSFHQEKMLVQGHVLSGKASLTLDWLVTPGLSPGLVLKRGSLCGASEESQCSSPRCVCVCAVYVVCVV